MVVFNSKKYIDTLLQHFERYFGKSGKKIRLEYGPKEKLNPDFYVLEILPNDRHNMFCYCTVGMSADRLDENLIELVLYSPRQDNSIVELLTFCASYHRNKLPLNIHHTVNIGQPWLDNSKCDHGFISLPYLDGELLELFNFGGQNIHCYWFIPITEKERDFKVENGCEALEQLFEEKTFNYLNPSRESLAS
jgi:Suppressor of fused protein (SUFU)